MTGMATALPKQAWLWIIRKTLFAVGALVVVSVIVTVGLLTLTGKQLGLTDLAVSIVMPILLGTPTTLGCFIAMERLSHANAQLTQLATFDGLTGILNRRAFAAQVEDHCRAARNQGVLLVIDADHFKRINDRFGHDQGDEALRLMAQTLFVHVGQSGLTGRLGGEEFGIYLPGIALDQAGIIADHLRRAIAAIEFSPRGTAYPLAVSVGGTQHTGQSTFRTLYREADAQLYAAKAGGRDCVILPFAA